MTAHSAGYRRPRWGCPVGGSGGPGSLGEGHWGHGELSSALGAWEEVAEQQVVRGSPPVAGWLSHTHLTSRLRVLEELGPFLGEGAFLIILSKSHVFLSLPIPVTISRKYPEKEGNRKAKNKPDKSSREGKWHCCFYFIFVTVASGERI